MCGEPRVAAECTCTERESGRCSRPTVRPGSNVNDKHDHGDSSSTRPRGRWTSGSLTETRVRDWQYLPERFDGSADRTMNPCSLDGTDPRARTVLAACVEPDGPVDGDGDQARVIMRATRPSCQVARRHGRGTRPPGRSCDGRDAAGARGPLSRDRRAGRPWRRVDVGAAAPERCAWCHASDGGRCCTNRHGPTRCHPTGSSPADAI